MKQWEEKKLLEAYEKLRHGKTNLSTSETRRILIDIEHRLSIAEGASGVTAGDSKMKNSYEE